MPFSYREVFFGRTKFCCCIPVRLGVIVMAVLGIIFSAILSIALWYEITANHNMSPGVRAAFVIGALVETFLFFASIFGLVGAIVRKLSFIRIYAIITYVHFLLNFGIAIWFLVVINNTTNSANEHFCSDAGDAQQQCMQLFSFGRNAYIAIALVILVIELYGGLIVTRYRWQLDKEKTHNRRMREGIEEAFKVHAAKARYSALASSHEMAPLKSPTYGDHEGIEYDPYREAAIPPPVPPAQTPRRFKTFVDEGRPAAPVEVGYGGGTWTHEEISEEEKTRMQRREQERENSIQTLPPILVDEAEMARRRSEMKAVANPSTSYTPEIDELPRYQYFAIERPEPHP